MAILSWPSVGSTLARNLDGKVRGDVLCNFGQGYRVLSSSGGIVMSEASSLVRRKRERSSRRANLGVPSPKAADSTLARLEAVRKACRAVEPQPDGTALTELAIALRKIFSARWVVVRSGGPNDPEGVAPEDADPSVSLDGTVNLASDGDGLPKTFTVAPKDDRSGASGADQIVVIPMDQAAGRGSIYLGLGGQAPTTGDELAPFALVGEMVGFMLWRLSQRAPIDSIDSDPQGALDLTTTELISIAAHELRTPLTPITMLLQSVERKARTNHYDVDAVVRTRKQVNRLAQMISDLLDLTRLREGRLVVTPTLVELGASVSEAVAWFQEAHPKRPIEVVTNDLPLVILFDQDRFLQAVSSLLEHVARITPSDSPIEIVLERRQDRAALTMSASRPSFPELTQDGQPTAGTPRSFTLAILFAEASWSPFEA